MSEPYRPYSHRRFWEDPGGEIVPCSLCSHYLGNLNCGAYPERIPEDILDMDTDVKAIPECAPGYKYEEKRGK
jgi:hypothetical protein